MRETRSLLVAVITLSAGAALMVLASRHPARPVVSIGILSYTNWGKSPSICARVGLTNTGRVTIKFNQMNYRVRIESPRGWSQEQPECYLTSGWVSWDFGPFAVTTLMPALLKPGSNTSATILLPADTLRWQVGYKVRTASLRERVASRIPAKWQRRLYPICQRLLSDKPGPEQEVLSGLFECPRNDAASLDGALPFLFDPFDPDKLWPANTDLE